ncbi:MAG: hypothetical protein HOB20_00575 [Planctomycetaceae bacterium]|jgi:hypothetical protein|nr:hypothetical protein [Planctomycetaceae bacterium]
MSTINRRDFAKTTVGSLVTYSLLNTLFQQQLFSAEIKPVAAQWIKDIHELGEDLKGTKLSQLQWKEQCEKLFAQADLKDLMKFVDFGGRISSTPFRDKGERPIRFKFPEVEGLPTNLIFGHQIFKLKKGQSVVPHGHNNMATAFLIMKGEFHGKHYDRLEESDSHMIIKPTIDAKFKPGECSTVTQVKDNVHWFKTESDEAYIFNIHILGLNTGASGRVYVDPLGEKISGGRIRARKIGSAEATNLYG